MFDRGITVFWKEILLCDIFSYDPAIYEVVVSYLEIFCWILIFISVLNSIDFF